jgi:hypothetical protein
MKSENQTKHSSIHFIQHIIQFNILLIDYKFIYSLVNYKLFHLQLFLVKTVVQQMVLRLVHLGISTTDKEWGSITH